MRGIVLPGKADEIGHRAFIGAKAVSFCLLLIFLSLSHVFAAGYDIANLNGYEDFLAAFRKLIGLRRLKVIHANDSKVPLGAKVDRHQQIGLGHLGTKTFQRLLADPRLDGRPFILETPKGKNGETDWDVINIALLKKFRKKPSPSLRKT